MTRDLPPAYDPHQTEEKWYGFWKKGGYFTANPDSKKPPYTIVMPPPNVTGVLHMGHALVSTLQDILIRWKRMAGYEALWIAGTDHAGIATQTIVERHLWTTEGKRREEYTREAFLGHVWKWKEKSEGTILSQLKKLGCSCDWTRLRFTMDAGCSRAVNTIFKKLFDAGLIYRGRYLVNWDPLARTALADDEVEYEERQSHLWYFSYPLADKSGSLSIATTRPETLLGDTAVAVSPTDTRYAHLIGKKISLPLLGREIPIIADHSVDPSFGSGAVKVTPAHDPNDYAIGLAHDLPFINILTAGGHINEQGGSYAGLSCEEAREAVVREMKKLGLLEKVEPHTLRVGVSYRSKAVIQPYLSTQWFIRMEPFRQSLQDMVHQGRVKILPKIWEHTYFHWINHLRDWCISRQLWWGHQIPIWYHKEDPQRMICFAGEGEPPEVSQAPTLWERDPDVLDTWFSSALWPFSTLGWPEKTPELATFYPTSVLVTGHDILFFWVARMLCMGEYALGQVPFPVTFLHGLIYGKSYWKTSKEGHISYITGEEKKKYDLGHPIPAGISHKSEKLSKSKGNVIDPLEMIAEYGTDAVRLALCSCANQTPQIELDRRRFEEYKNFVNKVWNGARFVYLNLAGLSTEALSTGIVDTEWTLEDRWILSALNRANRDMQVHLEAYAFDQALAVAYTFFWQKFCAYYVEITKPILFGKVGTPAQKLHKQKILVIVLVNTVRLLHPIAPFITEEIFQYLKEHFAGCFLSDQVDPYTKETVHALSFPSCMVAPYPTVVRKADLHPEIEKKFEQIEQIVYVIRNIRGEMNIPPHMATDVYLVGSFTENLEVIRALVQTHQITVVAEPPQIPLSATGIAGDIKVLIPLPQELRQREITRLEKEYEKTAHTVEKLQNLLSTPAFQEKAHPDTVQKQKASLQQAKQELKTLGDRLLSLKG